MQHICPSILGLCLFLTACHSASTSLESVSVAHCGDTIIVPSASPVRASISIEKLSLSDFSSSFSTVGTVRAEAGRLAEVAVPMDGRTGTCYVRPGTKVRAGQPLFAFYSAEFADIVRAWFEARSNNDLATRNLARKESLRHDGIISARELEEARNEAELARRELSQAQQSLSVLGVDTTQLKNDGELNIIAPITGEVMRCEVTNGQFVRSDEASLITIADLSRVWVTAQIKEQYIRSIHADDHVTVYADAYPDCAFEGEIVYVGGLVDETTRAIDVTIQVANPNHALKPGMYVRTEFSTQATPAIVIPSTAVMQGAEPYIYVALNDSTFVPQTVAIQSVNAKQVRVVSGLTPAESIITQGGIYLAQ